MEYRKRFLIIYLLIMLAAFGVLWWLTTPRSLGKRDMVAYNDEIHRISDEYRAGRSIAEIEASHGCRIILSTGTDARVMQTYADYGLVMDFAPDGEVIGRVLWNDVADKNTDEMRSQRTSVLIVWGIIFLVRLLFLFAVDCFLLRPMREMRAVAGEIAKGNLDVPLPIRKHNPFGNLAEGFDLMREELRASREREIEAEKEKKELVAELAHDIKTPVATIRATCEVLELKAQRRIAELESSSADLTEARDVLEKAQTISAKTETIRQLMENVFQTTLEELDHAEINRTEESTELIEAYFRNLRNYGTIVLDNSIPSCLVYMDRLRMEQVIDNVVGNSHKYAGTDIHVRFDEVTMPAADSEDARFVRIRISDSGPGVAEEELPLIMQKYYRGSVAKGKSGVGLGLYLVRTYMEKQGGGAEVYNDHGLTVDLYLRKV